MKLREFIEQLQQLDPDADVKIRTTEDNRLEEADYSYEDPIVKVRMLTLGAARYNSERRVVCLQ